MSSVHLRKLFDTRTTEHNRTRTNTQTTNCPVYTQGEQTWSIKNLCNFSECKPNWYRHNGLCVYECPTTTYGVSDETKTICAPCHYSCLTCSGPSDTECVSCHEDSELSNFNDSQCILKDLSWTMQSTIWFHRMSVLFSINLVVLMVAIIYMAVSWCSRNRNSLMYSYSKVSYSSNGDAQKDVDRWQANGCLSDSE